MGTELKWDAVSALTTAARRLGHAMLALRSATEDAQDAKQRQDVVAVQMAAAAIGDAAYDAQEALAAAMRTLASDEESP